MHAPNIYYSCSDFCISIEVSNIIGIGVNSSYPAIMGNVFILRMSPFWILRDVTGLCAPSVLSPDWNQIQAEGERTNKNLDASGVATVGTCPLIKWWKK